MKKYSVYGGCLDSAVALPHLRHSLQPHPTWTLTVAELLDPAAGMALLGEVDVEPGIQVRAYRRGEGLRLRYEDTGTFDVSADGARISWLPGRDVRAEAVELDVLGRVMPMALHAGGTLCLHGSAVAVGSAGIGFLAPKFHGKSTIAQALVSAGARLCSDDVVPVDPTSPAILRPGVHSVRLWSDSLERLVPGRSGEPTAVGGKSSLDVPPDDQLMLDPVPLRALYLLVPRSSFTAQPAPRRNRLPVMEASMALMRESKLGLLLGKREAPILLERAIAVAETVPVYALEFARDWSLLPRLVEQVLDWHAAPPPCPRGRKGSAGQPL